MNSICRPEGSHVNSLPLRLSRGVLALNPFGAATKIGGFLLGLGICFPLLNSWLSGVTPNFKHDDSSSRGQHGQRYMQQSARDTSSRILHDASGTYRRSPVDSKPTRSSLSLNAWRAISSRRSRCDTLSSGFPEPSYKFLIHWHSLFF